MPPPKPTLFSPHMTKKKNQPWISMQISEEKKKLHGNHEDQQQNTKFKQKSLFA